ncbi:MAG: glycosyltransferase family 4 protein [Sphingomonadales bacterium]
MKICFIASSGSIHSFRWTTFFADLGHEIHLISPVPKTYPIPENIHYHEIASALPKYLWFPIASLLIRKKLKEIKPDVLHIHSIGSYGLLAWLVNFKPLIITPWGSDILQSRNSFFRRFIVKKAISLASLLTCDAVHMKNVIIEFESDPSKIEIIYFGADIKKYTSDNFDQETKTKLSNGGNEKLVISLRWLDPLYDIESLIRAIPAILNKQPNTRFIVGGDGPQEDFLKQLAEDLNVRQNINFIGRLSPDEMPQILATCDIYVSTSLSDAGLASCTGEAMASGTAVVVTDSAENYLWVKNDETGALVPVKNPTALSESIIDLLSNDEKRERVGQAGMICIRQNYNYEVEMKKMEKLYLTFSASSQKKD